MNVGILLATYRPNFDWFKELLVSLNNQTYKDIFLYVCDDNSPEDDFIKIKEYLTKYITNFDFAIERNYKNLGSNKTFEHLILNSNSEYICFCDQDDIWNFNKIEILCNYLTTNSKKMVCSDVAIIDENNKLIANSITDVRKRFNFNPSNSQNYLIFKNYVIGCTILMEKQLALKALPFSGIMVHDQELAFCASQENELIVYKKSTIKYRIHSSNQTSVLHGINNREQYFEKHIMRFKNWVDFLKERYNGIDLKTAEEWANVRIDNYKGKKGSWRHLYRLRKTNKPTSLFELYALKCPPLFYIALRLIKKSII